MNPALKVLLRKNFLPFARKAILELEGTKIGGESYLAYLADELDQFAEGDTRRLIINLPPGHLKTLLGSVCLTAWMLAHDPALKIMVVTHAESLSKTIARNIRTILQSAWFKEVFATRIKLGHAEVTDFGTKSGGGVFVTSFGGRFTGHRADTLIVDDPHDIDDNPEQISRTIEIFNKKVRSRLNDRKSGSMLVIAHRVYERDLSAYLLRKKKKWSHVALPLVATVTQAYETASGKWRRLKGELLRPQAFDSEDIEELREDNINPDFEMLYQQDVDSRALPAITAEHFPTITEPMPSGAPVVLSVDAGMASGRRSAFSVIQVWRVGVDRYYLLDQFRERCDYHDLLNHIRRFRKKHHPVAILIERAANGYALISSLIRSNPKMSKLVLPIDTDGRSKSARLRAHADTILAKRIYLPADEPWQDAFISEFVEFPHGKFSDQVDATTQFLDHAHEFVGLKSRPRPGTAVFGYYSTGRTVVMPPSGSDELGLGAGVRGGGGRINVTMASSGGGTTTTSFRSGEPGVAVGRHSDGRLINWKGRGKL
jgi:predicted phage terminase large subunit-like protein